MHIEWCSVLKICILEKTNNKLRLLVEGFNLALVNAIRRSSITDVPIMAIEYVEVFENDTILYDEILAHRLAMIPLTSEEALEKYKKPEECKNAPISDTKCYAFFRLEISTNHDEERMIYSRDLESSDPSIKPVYDNIPIVLMAPNQTIRLQAYARLGYGKEHAKWIPVSVAIHRYVPTLKYDLSRASRECLACIEDAYPWLVEKMSENKKGVLEILDDINTSALYWCTTNKCRDAIKLDYDNTRFIFKFESTGALPVEKILSYAVKAIIKKANLLLEDLEKIKQAEKR